MQLYEISNEYRRIFDKLSEMDGITEEIIKDTLSPIMDNFNGKSISTVSCMKNLEAEANAVRHAENSMRQRRQQIEQKVERLREYIKNQMILMEIKNIKCPYFSITLSKGIKSVNILDESKIPDKFMKITKAPVKTLIKEAGGCEGAEIIEGYSLRIT